MASGGTKLNLCGPQVAQFRKTTREGGKPLTQATLSEKVSKLGAKLDRAAIAKIENNLRAVTDVELVALAKALQVTVNQLLGL